MKISRTKFVILFLVSAFAFQVITNLLLQPINGDWFPGTRSPIAWKRTVATVIYPVKIILVGPLSSFFKVPDPDPAPTVLALAFAIYWIAIASALYFLLSKIFTRRKA